jgi:hypothetical protein
MGVRGLSLKLTVLRPEFPANREKRRENLEFGWEDPPMIPLNY